MNKDQRMLPRFVKDLMIQMQPGIVLREIATSFLVLLSNSIVNYGLKHDLMNACFLQERAFTGLLA